MTPRVLNHNNIQDFVNQVHGINPIIEKYTVMTDSLRHCGSWVEEDEAIAFITREVKGGSKARYFLLEAKKEIGVKTPEIEIEEL